MFKTLDVHKCLFHFFLWWGLPMPDNCVAGDLFVFSGQPSFETKNRSSSGRSGMNPCPKSSAVSEAGFFPTEDFEDRVICASKLRRGPEGGYTGNSFWVAQRSAGWFVGT
jgi:hypothetical protein